MEYKWKEVGGRQADNMWDPEEVDAVEGVYIDKRTKVGPNESNIYVLEREDGSTVGIWGTAVLDSRFADIHIGETVRIEYLGKQKNPNTGRTYKAFRVLIAEKGELVPDESE